jgi:hypothetical protein
MDVYAWGTVVIRVSQIAMARYEYGMPSEREQRYVATIQMSHCVVVTLLSGIENWLVCASPEQVQAVLDDIKKRMERLTEADHAFIQKKLPVDPGAAD